MPPLKASRFPRAYQLFDFDEKKFYSPEEALSIGFTLTGDGLPYWTKAPKHVAILWYTGQKDSNDLPLFEGDICKMEVQNEFGSLLSGILGVMRWYTKDSRFILIMAGIEPHQIYQTEKVEKIGHEFTHPELLAQIEK
jgi:hypothetical protein